MEDLTLQLAQSELKKYNLTAKLKFDKKLPSFKITAKNGEITIAGPTSVELLYGVYELAEQIGGYCFFEPGKDRFSKDRKEKHIADGVIVPAKKPLLTTRGFVQEFPFDDETPQLFDWMAKNKMNYLQVWMKYYDLLSDELKEMARIRGITIESGHHNFNYWIPGRKYNQTHPEFFAEINGKRIVSSDGKSELLLSEQLCTTNKALRDEIVKNMLAYLDAHPEVKVIALNPNDGFGWCECKECSKFYDKNEKGDLYSVSEHVYKANRIYHDLIRYVSAKLHEKRPDVELTFCAYVNYCAPSKGMTLPDGLVVWIANYWRCINHTINDPRCPINSNYARDILDWVKVKRGGKVLVYEYFMGINFYISLPMVHSTDIFKEVKWYAKNGVDGVITQFHIPHWSVYGMNYYMFAKAARGENVSDAVPKMMTDLFGNGVSVRSLTSSVKATGFFKALKKALLGIGSCLIPYPRALLTRISMDKCLQLLGMAKDLRESTPGNRLSKDIVVWMEYLCRFKKLSDRNEAGKLTIKDVDDLEKWMHKYEGRRLFVFSRVTPYFDAIRDAVRNGKKWLHFNLDWEDKYVLKHEQMWRKK